MVNQMAMQTDRLGALISMTASAYGGRASFPPVDRPRTAVERMRHQRAESKHRALVKRLLPPSR